MQVDPEPDSPGKIGPPVVFQLMREVSRLLCRNALIVPFPGVTPNAPAVGFRFSPPPLNKKVRIEGCSKIIPAPPRIIVFALPNTSQANPTRGETPLYLVA